jgi:hypothetical protein
VRIGKSLVRIGLRLSNYISNLGSRAHGTGYAILTDPAHEFAMAHYYVTETAQRHQLMEAGFLPDIDVETDTEDALPYYLHYAARKASG